LEGEEILEAVNGFVLAGGASTRMGQDKALIPFRGRPLIQIAVEALQPVCRRVFLLAPEDRYSFLNLPRIADRLPNSGPLAALAAALEQSDTDSNLFLPCDMPFLTGDVLVRMLGLSRGVDAVVPRDQRGHWFPLSAGYRTSCRPAMDDQLQRSIFKVDSFFPQIVVRALPTSDFPEETFANINSPSDLERLRG
jgi:molybdopterin-guanine dinucleotide biosynthesis protein A